MREMSPPYLISCRPCVQVKLSSHSNVARFKSVGPCAEGPRVNEGPKITGGAVPAGSSGNTLVKPRAAGEVVSVGTACREAKRFAEKRNSLSFPPEKVCVQVSEPICVRFLSVPPEPTGTLPPLPSGCGPMLVEMEPPCS